MLASASNLKHGYALDLPKQLKLLGVAGVECVVVHTKHADHASELIADMPLEDLEGYSGILAVSPSAVQATNTAS